MATAAEDEGRTIYTNVDICDVHILKLSRYIHTLVRNDVSASLPCEVGECTRRSLLRCRVGALLLESST